MWYGSSSIWFKVLWIMKTEHIKRWRKGILQKHCVLIYQFWFLNFGLLLFLCLRVCINSVNMQQVIHSPKNQKWYFEIKVINHPNDPPAELTITLVAVVELFMIFPTALSTIATPMSRRVTMSALASLAVSERWEIWTRVCREPGRKESVC